MRLTAELLSQAEQRTNPLDERELVLSGRGIPDIENLGAARDAFECYDMSNNRLVRLHNFPRLCRLRTLLVSGNHVATIDAVNGLQNIPQLTVLALRNNQISSLLEVKHIGTAWKQLEFLDLVGNPVTRRPYYRLYAIHHIPSLKALDYERIRPSERETAQRWAASAAGAALESDVQQATAVFTPGESLDGSHVVTTFSATEKEQIRELLANAQSVQEVEAIEESVRKGILPEQLRQQQEKPAKRQKVNT